MKTLRSVFLAAWLLAALTLGANAQMISPTNGEIIMAGQVNVDTYLDNVTQMVQSDPAQFNAAVDLPITVSVYGFIDAGALFGPPTVGVIPGTELFIPGGPVSQNARYTFRLTGLTLVSGSAVFSGTPISTVNATYGNGTLSIFFDADAGEGGSDLQDYSDPADFTNGDLFLVGAVNVNSVYSLPGGFGAFNGAIVFDPNAAGIVPNGINDFLLANPQSLGGFFTNTGYSVASRAGFGEFGTRPQVELPILPPPPPPPPITRPVPPTLTVQKFYDTDLDGVKDADEPFILGWQVNVSDEADPTFSVLRLTKVEEPLYTGLFRVQESASIVHNWVATTDTIVENIPLAEGLEQFVAGSWVLVTPPQNGSVLFGNVCLENARDLAPRTIGYWQNKKGTAFAETQKAGLTALNLVNGLGAAFDPTIFDFKSTAAGSWSYWLSQANASSMAYMLSAQMAGTWLNTRFYLADPAAGDGINPGAVLNVGGYFNGTPLQTLVNSQNGTITVQQLLDAANTELGLPGHTVTPSGSPYRRYQELLKNLFDALNNDTTPSGVRFTPTAVVQPIVDANGNYAGPCAFAF